jgi:hypothetical protein
MAATHIMIQTQYYDGTHHTQRWYVPTSDAYPVGATSYSNWLAVPGTTRGCMVVDDRLVRQESGIDPCRLPYMNRTYFSLVLQACVAPRPGGTGPIEYECAMTV